MAVAHRALINVNDDVLVGGEIAILHLTTTSATRAGANEIASQKIAICIAVKSN